MVINSLASQTF